MVVDFAGASVAVRSSKPLEKERLQSVEKVGASADVVRNALSFFDIYKGYGPQARGKLRKQEDHLIVVFVSKSRNYLWPHPDCSQAMW